LAGYAKDNRTGMSLSCVSAQ